MLHPSDRLDARGTRSFRSLWVRVILIGSVIFRLWYAKSRELVPDEAFYWVLSRHLACGYLDHPPMVALLIRFSTSLLGPASELGVRLFAILFMFGSLGVMLVLFDRMVKDAKASLLLTIVWLCSPLFAALATLMTPDPPAFFFSGCALACAIVAVTQGTPDERRIALSWLGFGAFCGLALLSKYTTVLLPASVVLALACSPVGRRQLARPWIYLAALLAFLIFSPVIYWNARHGWVSFAYQLHHGLATGQSAAGQPAAAPGIGKHLQTLGEYVGAQFLVWTPVLLAIGLFVLIRAILAYRALELARQMLVWSAALPLVFFGYASWRAHGEANWPAFAYFPLSLLTVDYVASHWTARLKHWAYAGAGLALVISIVMQSPELIYQAELHAPARFLPSGKPGLPKKLVEMYGWQELARTLAAMDWDRALVVCNTHQDAGEMAFYMPGQPEVWAIGLGADSRPTAFDYFDDKPDFYRVPRVLLVNGHKDEFCQKYGFVSDAEGYWFKTIFGHVRDRKTWMCVRPELRPPPPLPVATQPAR